MEMKLIKMTFLSALSCSKMGRFLFIICYIALNHLAYIENFVGKIKKQKQKNDKSQPTTKDLLFEV